MTDNTRTALLTRVELLEREIEEIKRRLLASAKPEPVSLRGIWKGINISDEDIEAAKRSIFRDLDDI
jgi:hypothetical protein